MEADHRPLPPSHIEQQQHHHMQQQPQFLHHPTTHLTLLHHHHPPSSHPHSQPPPFLAHPLIFHAPLHPHLLHFHHIQQQQQQHQLCHPQERILDRGHDQIHHPVGLHPMQLRHTVHQPQPHLPQEGHSLLAHHSQPHFQLRQFDQQPSEPVSEELLQHPQDYAVGHREEIVEDHQKRKENSPKEINTGNESYSSSSSRSSSNREENRDGFQIQCRDTPVEVSQNRPLAPIATSLGDPSFGEVLASIQSAVRNQALQNQQHISTHVPSMDHSLDPPADVTSSLEEQGVQAEAQMEHSSPTVHSFDQPKGKKKRKKLKQVQFQLDPPVHQKLMRIVCEKHDGRLEKFVSATLDTTEISDKLGKKMATRKHILSKWKRTRFEQMKANETQELAMVFRSLVESTPGLEVTSELFSIPWQELTMTQIEKMLEETKKMLFLNEKVHDCSECGKRFATPSSLKDHQNEHSGAKPYNCKFEDCAMQFKSKQLLCRHIKKHECAHKCTFEGCGKRFAFRERLIVHQKIHSNERPLVCPWEGCGKSFKWTNSLHGHLRTHTGEKPFQCSFQGCGRLFGYKVDLTRHLRTHYGEPARGSH